MNLSIKQMYKEIFKYMKKELNIDYRDNNIKWYNDEPTKTGYVVSFEYNKENYSIEFRYSDKKVIRI